MEITQYIPTYRKRPPRVLTGYPSAWNGLESILEPMLNDFQVKRGSALEFGSEHGHSAIALSNFFDQVMCVDPWGQMITDQSRPMLDVFCENVAPYDNIFWVQETWQEFVKKGVLWPHYDLCHYDGEHTYEQTYLAGCWMAEHAPVVIFHDVYNPFVGVVPAVRDVAEKFNRKFYRFQEFEGLGILVP